MKKIVFVLLILALLILALLLSAGGGVEEDTGLLDDWWMVDCGDRGTYYAELSHFWSTGFVRGTLENGDKMVFPYALCVFKSVTVGG